MDIKRRTYGEKGVENIKAKQSNFFLVELKCYGCALDGLPAHVLFAIDCLSLWISYQITSSTFVDPKVIALLRETLYLYGGLVLHAQPYISTMPAPIIPPSNYPLLNLASNQPPIDRERRPMPKEHADLSTPY